MNRAFLSHSSKQKDVVEKIAMSLGKSNCVYDDFEFETGMPLLQEIIDGLEKSDLFVLFISDDSLSSDWVIKEIDEAKENIYKVNKKRIFPILIDKSIDVGSDSRIPSWLKEYLLKPITDTFLISKKIKQKLRELSLENNPLFRAKEELFVGRNDVFDAFEEKIFSISNTKPNSVIVSGFPGIGRRTFLKMALKRSGKVKDYYDPIYISLDTKDSIEDFIIKLQDFEKETTGDFLSQLENISFEEKISLAKSLMQKVQDSNEHVFIIDSGCIVKPNTHVAEWYLETINELKHKHMLTLCIISRFRPSSGLLKTNKEITHYSLSPLSDKDTQKLFVKYSTLLDLDLDQETSSSFLEYLNGIPSQVHYCVEYIKEFGTREATKNLKEIIEFGETQVYYTISLIQEMGDFQYDILVLLSNFEFVSYDFIENIASHPDLENTLEEFYILGVHDLVGANKEYIKVNYAIRDYINRSKVKVKPYFQERLRKSINIFVSEKEEQNDFKDISQLLYNIKGAILDGHTLPRRYYIPSFILKTIVELYYRGSHANVISLIDKVLENPRRLDESLIFEFQYWLCLSLARLKDSRFELEIEKIDGSDYNYLYGFYFRFKKDYNKAITFLEKTLKRNPNFQRAKRELVNIYLLKGEYDKALNLSKDNYKNSKLNAFHIQAYFICIIRKPFITKDDKEVIQEMFSNIEKSYDFKSKEIANVMKGEYEFYVNKNSADAIEILRECIRIHSSKHYPIKALKEIYKKSSMHIPYNQLNDKHKHRAQSYLD